MLGNLRELSDEISGNIRRHTRVKKVPKTFFGCYLDNKENEINLMAALSISDVPIYEKVMK